MVRLALGNVRFVAKSRHSALRQECRYSITSSARSSANVGTPQSERLGSLEIKHELEFRGPLEREIA